MRKGTYFTLIIYGLLALSSSVKAQDSVFTEVFASETKAFSIKSMPFFENNSIYVWAKDISSGDVVFISNNLGDSWQTSSTSERWFGSFFTAYFDSALIVNYDLLGETLGLSKDGGATFTKLQAPDTLSNMRWLKRIGPNVMLAYENKTYISYDTCKSFTAMSEQLYELNYWAYEQDSQVIITCGHCEAFNVSYDYGKTWTSGQYRVNPFKKGYGFRHLTDSMVVAFDIDEWELLWSEDQCRSFPVVFPLPADSNSHLTDLQFATRNIGYALVDSRKLYKTYDGGKSWKLNHTFRKDVSYIKTLKYNSLAVYQLSREAAIYISKNGAEPVGIEPTTKKDSHLKVYPNPSRGSMRLETNLQGQVSFALHTLTGQELRTGSFSQSIDLSLSGFPAGVYMLSVQNGQFRDFELVQVLD